MTKIAIIAMIAAMLEPAITVIAICGGYAETADMAGCSEIRVRRWTYPKSKGGTDGLIPAERQVRLLREAKVRGKDLRPEHFFRREEADAPPDDAPPSDPTPSAEDAA